MSISLQTEKLWASQEGLFSA